jgi:hypothetical protein
MELANRTTEITLKLTTSGRYIWQIVATFPSSENEEGIKLIQACDSKLKDAFPNYSRVGGGRLSSIEED